MLCGLVFVKSWILIDEMKEKNLKQGITSAQDLTTMLPEGLDTRCHRSN